MTAQRIGHSAGESSKRQGGNFKFASASSTPSKSTAKPLAQKKQSKRNDDDDDDDDDDDNVPLVKVSYANKRAGQTSKKPLTKLQQQEEDESVELEKTKKSSKKSGNKLNVKTGTSRSTPRY